MRQILKGKYKSVAAETQTSWLLDSSMGCTLKPYNPIVPNMQLGSVFHLIRQASRIILNPAPPLGISSFLLKQRWIIPDDLIKVIFRLFSQIQENSSRVTRDIMPVFWPVFTDSAVLPVMSKQDFICTAIKVTLYIKDSVFGSMLFTFKLNTTRTCSY